MLKDSVREQETKMSPQDYSEKERKSEPETQGRLRDAFRPRERFALSASVLSSVATGNEEESPVLRFHRQGP